MMDSPASSLPLCVLPTHGKSDDTRIALINIGNRSRGCGIICIRLRNGICTMVDTPIQVLCTHDTIGNAWDVAEANGIDYECCVWKESSLGGRRIGSTLRNSRGLPQSTVSRQKYSR